MTASATKTAIAFAALVSLASTSALARDLTIGLSAEPSSIDPHFHNLSPNNQTRLNMFESLIAQDETQKPQPRLATKWEAVDETTWRFTLRQGVKFSNGADFTAKDVIYTACRVPTVKDSPSAFTTYTKAFADMKAEGDHTLLIKTDAPAPLLPTESVAWGILSASANGVTGPITFKREGCEGIGTPPQSADFNKPEVAVGTGPYKLVSYTRGDRLILERNENYWGDKPIWDKVVMRPITSDGPRVARCSRVMSISSRRRPFRISTVSRNPASPSSKACRTASSICIWTRRAIRRASRARTARTHFSMRRCALRSPRRSTARPS